MGLNRIIRIFCFESSGDLPIRASQIETFYAPKVVCNDKLRSTTPPI
jgi:hypothetical protein